MKSVIISWVVALLAVAMTVSAAEQTITAKVKGQRVNLRAKPDMQSEVVGQVGEGDTLTIKSVQPDWLEVVPPDSVDLWLHRDFIQDGKILGNKVNVRAGAGVNYTVVGTLSRDDVVTARGGFGEWVSIAPPAVCSLWVSRDLIDLPPKKAPPVTGLKPEHPKGAVAIPVNPSSMTNPPPLIVATGTPAVVEAPTDLRLIPLEGQGKTVIREGELKPAPFVFGRPSRYRLTRREGNLVVTICYLRGNSEQLRSLVGEQLIVRGREYWVQGVRQPIVVVEGFERQAVR